METVKRRKGKIFYGWHIMGISFVMMSLGYGVYYSWPIFYIEILKEFGWTRAETAAIFSVSALVYGIGSAVAGILSDKFGPKKMFIAGAACLFTGVMGASITHSILPFYLTLGVLVAFGTTCAGYVPNTTLVSRWFNRRRATALGISQIGTRNSFLLAPLLQLLVLAVGWRYSYVVMGGIVAVVMVPLALMVRTKPQDMGLLPDGDVPAEANQVEEKVVKSSPETIAPETEWTIAKAFRSHRFWGLCMMMFGSGFVYTATTNHQVALTIDLGYSPIFAASLLTICAVTSIIGRTTGFISDRIGRELSYTLAMTFTLISLPMLLLARSCPSPWLLYIYAVAFGLGNGMQNPTYTSAAGDIFQGRQFGTIIGLANINFGLTSSLGTWVYAYIFDVTGTYNLAIVISILATLLMLAGMWLAAPRKVQPVRSKLMAHIRSTP